MHTLIDLIVSPYQRLFRAYQAMRDTDPVRAKWIFEFLPTALLSVLATILFFTGQSLFWAIGLWLFYCPLWVVINFRKP